MTDTLQVKYARNTNCMSKAACYVVPSTKAQLVSVSDVPC